MSSVKNMFDQLTSVSKSKLDRILLSLHQLHLIDRKLYHKEKHQEFTASILICNYNNSEQLVRGGRKKMKVL